MGREQKHNYQLYPKSKASARFLTTLLLGLDFLQPKAQKMHLTRDLAPVLNRNSFWGSTKIQGVSSLIGFKQIDSDTTSPLESGLLFWLTISYSNFWRRGDDQWQVIRFGEVAGCGVSHLWHTKTPQASWFKGMV